MIALGVFGLFYITFGIYLTINQERMVYRPFPQDFASCPHFDASETISFQGTRMYVSGTTGPTAVLYHGNAGSACDRYFYAEKFARAGYNYIIVEYAGYSNDTRQPQHELIKQDVENVIAYLDNENADDITVVGESIGTGFATYHADLAPPKKLLLVSPFTDLSDIARRHFWFYPTSLLVDNALSNIESMQHYSGRVTIIHGTEDTIIPYQLGRNLFATITTEKEFIDIEGAGHNDLFTVPETSAAIQHFLQPR